MITIYGIRSPFVFRVRCALMKKGLAFEHVDVDMAKRSEEFQKLSAVGKIPILQDEDGTVVWDSLHIVDYLDAKYPDTYPMMGKNPKERAMVLNVVALLNLVHGLIQPIAMEKYGISERLKAAGLSHRAIHYDNAAKKDARTDVKQRLASLKNMFGDGPFFTGEFSLADAATIITLSSLQKMGEDIGEWTSWVEDCLADKSIAQMFPAEDEKGVRRI